MMESEGEKARTKGCAHLASTERLVELIHRSNNDTLSDSGLSLFDSTLAMRVPRGVKGWTMKDQ